MERYAIPNSYFILRTLAVLFEFCLLFFLCGLAYGTVSGFELTTGDLAYAHWAIFALAWAGTSAMVGQYIPSNLVSLKHFFFTFPVVLAAHFTGIMGFFLIFQSTHQLPTYVLFAYGYAVMGVSGYRLMIHQVYKHRWGLFRSYKVVIVGNGATANSLYDFLRSSLAEVHRFMEQKDLLLEPGSYPTQVAEEVQSVKRFCLEQGVDEIVCALPAQNQSLIKDMAHFADSHYIKFKFANEFELLGNREVEVHFFDRTPVVSLRRNPLATYLANRLYKRVFDLLFSGLVLVTIFPIMLLTIGLAIKLTSRGPIFYRQWRSGRRNQKFRVWKFRTMYVQREDRFVQATKDDPRITRIGAFLRRTSLDEFPQFINVFLGHMSVVGPRPHPLPLNDIYAPQIDEYFFRYYITPGITGYAQIHGYRGETQDAEVMRKRIEHDAWYIENWSMLLDLKIIWLTVWNVLKGEENAY